MRRVEFVDLEHFILLQEKLVTNAVIRATKGFNLQCSNVARQVEEKCCPYYRILTTKCVAKRSNGYILL